MQKLCNKQEQPHSVQTQLQRPVLPEGLNHATSAYTDYRALHGGKRSCAAQPVAMPSVCQPAPTAALKAQYTHHSMGCWELRYNPWLLSMRP